jgi:hypothetical protein
MACHAVQHEIHPLCPHLLVSFAPLSVALMLPNAVALPPVIVVTSKILLMFDANSLLMLPITLTLMPSF